MNCTGTPLGPPWLALHRGASHVPAGAPKCTVCICAGPPRPWGVRGAKGGVIFYCIFNMRFKYMRTCGFFICAGAGFLCIHKNGRIMDPRASFWTLLPRFEPEFRAGSIGRGPGAGSGHFGGLFLKIRARQNFFYIYAQTLVFFICAPRKSIYKKLPGIK